MHLASACPKRRPAFAQPFNPTISGLIMGASAAAAGLILGQLSKPDTAPTGPPCEACNGDGYVDCLCARWNYATSDARRPGCESCNGSLRTRCPRCRGGGTAVPTAIRVPIPVRIRGPLENFLNRSVAFVPVFPASKFLSRKHPAPLLLVADSPNLQTHRTRIQRKLT